MKLSKPAVKRRERRIQKQKLSTRKLIDLKEITACTVKTYSDREFAYISLSPDNLSVLPPESMTARVNALMNVLRGISDVVLLCLNSRQSFDSNKNYLRERIREEPDEKVGTLLGRELDYLEREQATMAAAREFYLIIEAPANRLELTPYLRQVEQLAGEQGFRAKIAVTEDIKRILSVYFAGNYTSDVLEDFDGQGFL